MLDTRYPLVIIRYKTTNGTQSTKPFQADIEALRAVSTVPPMTTNFWPNEVNMRAHMSQHKHTKVSWRPPEFIAKGDNMLFRVSMVRKWGEERKEDWS